MHVVVVAHPQRAEDDEARNIADHPRKQSRELLLLRQLDRLIVLIGNRCQPHTLEILARGERNPG